MLRATGILLLASCGIILGTLPCTAQVYDLSVNASDAIFLAGRTDVTVPPLGQSFRNVLGLTSVRLSAILTIDWRFFDPMPLLSGFAKFAHFRGKDPPLNGY